MFVEDLTDLDYEILDYISQNEPVHIDDIKNHFPNIASIEYRIEVMKTPEYHQSMHIRLVTENTFCISEKYEIFKDELGISHNRYLQIYSITSLGKKALQDYKVKKAKHRKELWLKNAWIPILVSLATNLLIAGIKSLLPLIQSLVSNFLL